MEVTALSSGSSGNCFYISHDSTAVLIDAGISAKQIVQRLASLGKSAEHIRALFITHEHIDHVRGADVLARKLEIPIYVTKKTAQNCLLCKDESYINYITNAQTLKIGSLTIEAFSKSHHALDPVSYTVTGNKKVAIITDAGYTCKNIQKHIASADFLCLEANHDEEMLLKGPYPAYLKALIKGDKGHLSNIQAATCTKEHASSKLQHIILSHLSKTNNTPQLALDTFQAILAENNSLRPNIHVSHKEFPTPLFKI